MQQYRQLSCRGNDGPLLAAFSAALGQLQAPAPEITIDPERPQNMLCPLHQQGSQIRVAFLADMHTAAGSAPSFSFLAAVPDNNPRRGFCQNDADLPA